MFDFYFTIADPQARASESIAALLERITAHERAVAALRLRRPDGRFVFLPPAGDHERAPPLRGGGGAVATPLQRARSMWVMGT